MTLRRKTFCILTTTAVASLALSFAAAQIILSAGLMRIEDDIARSSVRQARAVWNSTLDSLDLVLADWAAWDDSCDFVDTLNPTYIKSTLIVEAIANIHLDAIAYFNSAGRFVFSRQLDAAGQQEVPLSPSLAAHLQPDSPLLKHDNNASSHKGVLLLPEGPVLVASRPIIKSDKTGPSKGTLVMVRRLDSQALAALRQMLLRPPQIVAVTTPHLPLESRLALAGLCAGMQRIVQRPTAERLAAYELIRDVYGAPALLVKIDMPREVYREGQAMIRTLLASLLIAGLVASAVLARLLSGGVLARVARLNGAARSISASKDVTQRVPVGRSRDELNDLAASFNEMLGVLQATEQEMAAARRSAELAAEMKSRFLANVSHEIRTPLNCIIGFAESILAGSCPPPVRHEVETILHESEVLLALINDLLDEAKIEAGKVELEARAFELLPLLDQILDGARAQARHKSLAMTAMVENGVPRVVVGDSLRMRQILANLVSNAVKFTEEGSVTVRVEPETREGTPFLRFSVVDTGIGIPRDRQKAIFESFVQAEAGTTREYGGTGLGTTIARQLVELMGGEIGLESTPGHGSTFWFSIPCITPAANDSESGHDSTQGPHTSCGLRKGSILVVEDYPASREVARVHLERAGHAVTTAESGPEALSACEAFAFDLILMDVQMPGIDGIETTIRIRTGDSPNARVPIIGLTADVEGSTRNACRAAGMNDVIFKPLRRKNLMATVSRWLAPYSAYTEANDTGRSAEPEVELPARAVLPLDYESVIREFGGVTTVNGIAQQFLENLDRELQSMEQALADGDLATLRSRCHAVKGGAATLMAGPLARQARMLERLDAADTQALRAGLARLREEAERLRQYVHAHTAASQESETHAQSCSG